VALSNVPNVNDERRKLGEGTVHGAVVGAGSEGIFKFRESTRAFRHKGLRRSLEGLRYTFNSGLLTDSDAEV
jgi:hypothetical protein